MYILIEIGKNQLHFKSRLTEIRPESFFDLKSNLSLHSVCDEHTRFPIYYTGKQNCPIKSSQLSIEYNSGLSSEQIHGAKYVGFLFYTNSYKFCMKNTYCNNNVLRISRKTK